MDSGVLVMISWTGLTLILAGALAGLVASACAAPGPLPVVVPEPAARHTIGVASATEPIAEPPPTPRTTLSPVSINAPQTHVPSLALTPTATTATQALASTTTSSPVLTPSPTTAPSPTLVPTHTPLGITPNGPVRITIVYDNNAYDERLTAAWGFSCLVERGDLTLLFDTGGDGRILLSNMERLGLSPTGIDTIVLSHIHSDHVGGLQSILAVNDDATVVLPRSFPTALKRQVEAKARVVEVHEPTEIAEGIYTTGEMGGDIIEQSLLLATHRGLIVITGCAHPGIVSIVERAVEMASADDVPDDEVFLAMGGFHLSAASQSQIASIVASFRQLGVQGVGPCHCTGNQALQMFAAEYGEDFVKAGVGLVLHIEP